MLRVAGTVAEPVLDHELDPRRRHQVQACRGDEFVPGQQLAADLPRARLHDLAGRFLVSVLQGHITAEARARHAHGGMVKVVV